MWSQAPRQPVGGQQLGVDVRQIRVGDNHVGAEDRPVLEPHARGAAVGHLDPRDRRAEDKARALRLGDGHQALDHSVQPPHREPDAPGKLRILQERIGGGRLEGAEPQVHVLEGEGGLQVRRVEVVADVGVMADQWLEIPDQLQVGRVEVVPGVIKVAADEPGERKVIVPVPLLQIAQQARRSCPAPSPPTAARARSDPP